MFTATRVAAGVAILALAVTLTLVAVPAGQDEAAPVGAPTVDIDPTAFGGFSGTVTCRPGIAGEVTRTDWGTITVGETYPRCTFEVSDSRFDGVGYSVHDSYTYDGKPRFGVRSYSSVITNDGGTWVADGDWGYQQPEDGTMLYVGRYRGTGAYDGLSALTVMTQDEWGFVFDVEGVIIPGELPEAPEPPTVASSASE